MKQAYVQRWVFLMVWEFGHASWEKNKPSRIWIWIFKTKIYVVLQKIWPAKSEAPGENWYTMKPSWTTTMFSTLKWLPLIAHKRRRFFSTCVQNLQSVFKMTCLIFSLKRWQNLHMYVLIICWLQIRTYKFWQKPWGPVLLELFGIS